MHKQRGGERQTQQATSRKFYALVKHAANAHCRGVIIVVLIVVVNVVVIVMVVVIVTIATKVVTQPIASLSETEGHSNVTRGCTRDFPARKLKKIAWVPRTHKIETKK